nr:PREDICTED: Krueppel-like factor 8 [Struthio camelus australis]
MSSSSLLAEGPIDPPVLLSDIKTEPPEELLASDCSQPQAEPVDLSLNKSKPLVPAAPPPPVSVQSSPMLVAPPIPASTVSISPSGLSSTSAIPAVLSPGSILASTQGSGGQQILHVIHTIPSVNLPSKMGNLQTIPVVVQSLPVVYTTMPTDGVTAITVPLIGGDGKNAGSGKACRVVCMGKPDAFWAPLIEQRVLWSLVPPSPRARGRALSSWGGGRIPGMEEGEEPGTCGGSHLG